MAEAGDVQIDLAASESLRPLLDAVSAQDARTASARLREIPQSTAELFPTEWLDLTAFALERGDFELLSEGFTNSTFIGPAGYLLLVAPYTVRRATGDVCKLSALFGRTISIDRTKRLVETIEDIQGAKVRGPMTPLRPMIVLATAGVLVREPFIVPDGWNWGNSPLGPPLLDMSTFDGDLLGDLTRQAISKVFDADTASCVLAPLEGNHGMAHYLRSFEIHETGHASGLGMLYKTRENLLPGYWYRGIEE